MSFLKWNFCCVVQNRGSRLTTHSWLTCRMLEWQVAFIKAFLHVSQLDIWCWTTDKSGLYITIVLNHGRICPSYLSTLKKKNNSPNSGGLKSLWSEMIGQQKKFRFTIDFPQPSGEEGWFHHFALTSRWFICNGFQYFQRKKRLFCGYFHVQSWFSSWNLTNKWF